MPLEILSDDIISSTQVKLLDAGETHAISQGKH